MRNILPKNLDFIATWVLLAFLAINVFSLSYLGGMEKRDNGTMNGCIFDGRAEICTMSILGHISSLQGMFTAIPQKTNLLILLFALILTIGALAVSALKQNRLLQSGFFGS